MACEKTELSTTFEGAQVGDEVETDRHGKGKIVEIAESGRADKIGVQFYHNIGIWWFCPDGRYALNDLNPKLHWPNSIHVTPQPRPKRKVKKTIKMYMPIGINGEPDGDVAYTSLDVAGRPDPVKAWGQQHIVLTGEYEVEE